MTGSPLYALQTRRSTKRLRAPAPSDEELDQLFRAAMAAPDHGALRPWRFKYIRGEAIGKLTDFAIAAAKRAGDARMTPQKEASVRDWTAHVPLFIAVACQIEYDHPVVPEQEQLLATGAAVMNLLNAAHMMGYGAFWSTGLGTYLDEVQEALGFDPLTYRFLGFLALGTPIKEVLPGVRPDHHQFVSEWTECVAQDDF